MAGLQPRPHTLATIGLGANLGDAAATLRRALVALQALPSSRWVGASSLYRSAPQEVPEGFAAGHHYVNAVAQMATQLSAPALLQALQTIEQAEGRLRPYRNAPRTLDLDLLLYGQGRMDSPQLTLPHPRMWQRAFVLHPLAELVPQWVSQAQLASVADQGVERLRH
jgi:2-amino-4-hydroxy-6-hydroxymethyldihydropteridine diphosphokinase